jgi:serine phosphatase RsbU (regulator of sigma subunit)
MADLTIERSDGTRQRFPIAKARITIGRSRDSDVFLPDQWLSRHHAEIREASGGSFVLVDLGSKNGTLLNGERVVAECRLRPGDVISLGEHILTYTQAEPVEEDAPEGTRIYSAQALSDIRTKPSIDPEELKRQNRVLAVLSTAAGKLVEHKPLADIFDTVLRLLFDAVSAERGAIVLVEDGEPVIKASRSRQGQLISRVSRSIARKTIEECRALLIPNIMEDSAFANQDSILATGIRSAVCAPLFFTPAGSETQTVIGLVYLDSLLGTHAFTEEDLQIVTALANVAAAKIENVRLLEESLEMRKMEEDMRMAAEIQRGLLPGAPPHLPGYEVAGINLPCRAVGGDYFDFNQAGPRFRFALGDVSGKGTGAALLMTVLRAAVRAHWADGEPAEVIGRINSTVCQNIPTNKYITFFLASLEPASGQIQYVNAGHNPPLLVRACGEVEDLAVGGTVLGLMEGFPFEQGEARLEAGDLLVVYSDGVTETWNEDEVEFGEERLRRFLSDRRSLPARALQDQLLQHLDAFAGGAKATDDRTLIIVKR